MFNPKEHLMDLKGKSYLQVMWRLVWFREEKPLWNIDTKLEKLGEDYAVFSAKIYDENGVQKSAGYGSESVKDFRDYIEKAETKAVGRALAMLGYGTQFAPSWTRKSGLWIPRRQGSRRPQNPSGAPPAAPPLRPSPARAASLWGRRSTPQQSKRSTARCSAPPVWRRWKLHCIPGGLNGTG